jgi:hypothetical protein
MALFSPSVFDRIRSSFRFLLETGRYRLVAESEGMGGAITYRSPELWVAVEWDRSLPWLDFSPTHESVGRFDWTLVDLLLNEAAHYSRDPKEPEVAEPERLADWLRPRLNEIETRFSEPLLPVTNARLGAYEKERAGLREAHWIDLERQYRERKSSRGLSKDR